MSFDAPSVVEIQHELREYEALLVTAKRKSESLSSLRKNKAWKEVVELGFFTDFLEIAVHGSDPEEARHKAIEGIRVFQQFLDGYEFNTEKLEHGIKERNDYLSSLGGEE